MPLAVILLRFAEYAGAAMLFGAPLFLLYAGLNREPALRGTARLMTFAAVALTVAAPLHFFAQTAEIAGSIPALLDSATLQAAFREMDFAKASLVRGLAALLALGANAILPFGRTRWRIVALLGALACASFSWMGHGAATEGNAGWLHLGSDILHSLAASAWIGALVVFGFWLMQKNADPRSQLAALRGFSMAGIVLVCVIMATGIVNSLFMIGLSRLSALWQDPYGQLLSAKIAAFLAMLWLAARNRAVLTPALAHSLSPPGEPNAAVTALRRSILLELGFGVGVLALVAWLGTLPPPASHH